ncbi:MAG: DUF2807 domain-containing protein [Proteobacteria bacterium]|nr:DUF2807 domain-containing protein [Pseudomonadota bacterium]
MKYAVTSIAAALVVALPAHAEVRNLSGFTEVQAQDNIVVEVRTGPQYAVEVTGPEANRIITRVERNQLKVSERNRPWFGPDRRINALVRITMPAVSSLAAAKGATLSAFDIGADDMSLAAAMGGELRINGSCHSVDVAAAMGGVVRAEGFRCATADISAAMGGEARVFATNTFDATAAMGGSVNIAGGAHGDTTAVMGGSVSIADGGKADHSTAVMGGEVNHD